MTFLIGKNTAKAFMVTLLLLSPQAALSHGEDRPGPHGGHIRMPGVFHTEVVQAGKDTAKIYLLDLHWKNPTRKGKVEARLGKKVATCRARDDHFSCVFPKESDLSKGILTILAEREGDKGVEVFYELPLRHKKINGHLGH